MSQKDIDYERKNWYTLAAKRIYLKDSFDFKVQSIGVYSNLELIHLACDKIKEQLQAFMINVTHKYMKLICVQLP